MKIIWLSDLHCDKLKPNVLSDFLHDLAEKKPDIVFITGDTSDSQGLEQYLSMIAVSVSCDIYFVLGNHEMYRSSFKETDEIVKRVMANFSNLHNLSDLGVVELNSTTAVIGASGWTDGWSNGRTPFVLLYDFFQIRDFRRLFNFKEYLEVLGILAKKDVDHIQVNLEKAVKKYDTIYILTHWPAFKEITIGYHKWFEFFWEPYNYSRNMGQMIIDIGVKHPNTMILCKSGHRHSYQNIQILSNIQSITAGARFGYVKIQETFDI